MPAPGPSVVVPSAARANSDEGAIEFAKFFVRQIDAATVTQDVRFITAHSANECRGCRGQLEGIAESKKDGVRQEALSVMITGAELRQAKTRTRDEQRIVWVHTRTREVRYLDASGRQIPDATTPGVGTVQVELVPHEGSWQVSELGEVVKR